VSELTAFKNILCVVDSTGACTAAVERAVILAENNQAGLTVVDVVDRVTAGIEIPARGPVSADLQSALETRQMRQLETLINPFRQQVPIRTKILSGTRFLKIIRQVLRDEHDLVIKVPEKLTWLDRLLGSDDMNLLRECPSPVWFVKAQAEKSYRRILAAVDMDDAYPPSELESRQALNRRVLEMAGSLALSDFAELHVVHAWQAIGESAMRGAFMHTSEAEIAVYVAQVRRRQEAGLDRLMRDMVDQLGKERTDYISPRTHLVKGSARNEIPALAKQLAADVIVMGTVARTGVPGFFMGNTAETILNQIDCSVLAIKPPGFETPVTLED
jgi:nucleotide-binding universal stress UspA family protein